jgi:3-hydroxybutyryl-CoA dehydrogenase
LSRIEKVAVLGAGLMGHGIAQVASQNGKYEVTMFARHSLNQGFEMISRSLELFQKKKLLTKDEADAVLSRIHGTSDLLDAVSGADLVIESIPENIQGKKDLLALIDKYISSNTLITTNTSSINIDDLSSALSRPENFCGTHFFNPAQLMRLVEITTGKKTSTTTIQTILRVMHRMGKETVVVKKDSPGFIINRVLLPALNEAAKICWEGVADRDDIDKAFKLALNWPMGPLMLIDYIGVDTVVAIAKILDRELPQGFNTSEGLKKLFEANELGRKTGKGYYSWEKKLDREHKKNP